MDPSTFNEYQRQRYEKIQELREQGIDPYPPRAHRTHLSREAVAAFEAAMAEGQPGEPVWVTVGGRIVAIRVMGKASFAHIEDAAGQLQLYFKHDLLGQESYGHFKELLDLDDFIQARGTMFRTRTGEPTVEVHDWQIVSKALNPPPSKWHGVTDAELRYRQRYVDLMANPEVRDIFIVRSRVVSAIRRFLESRGFIEVETPVLQPLYGGAAAEPFITHHNWARRDLYLRISPELYLKRLLVGGLERVFEIGKNFRNEGVSFKHSPEFTMLEAYQAFADYHDMMKLAEECWSTVAREVLGSPVIHYQGHVVDLTPPWKRVAMHSAILDQTGIDLDTVPTLGALQASIRQRGVEVDTAQTWGKQVDKLFSAYVEPTLIQPTFIVDYPVELSPLAKRKPDKPGWVERFEGFVGGVEAVNAFTELNDPIDQEQRFLDMARDFAAGDTEAHPLDEDFINALMYGMPPTGGIGWGIDRMMMIFLDRPNIREVILYPQLRAVQEELT